MKWMICLEHVVIDITMVCSLWACKSGSCTEFLLIIFKAPFCTLLKASACFFLWNPLTAHFHIQDMVLSESNMNWWGCPWRLQIYLFIFFPDTASLSQHCLFAWVVPNGNFSHNQLHKFKVVVSVWPYGS